jgi:hypothetical protein
MHFDQFAPVIVQYVGPLAVSGSWMLLLLLWSNKSSYNSINEKIDEKIQQICHVIY